MKVYVDTSNLESHDIQSITNLGGKEIKQVRLWFEDTDNVEIQSLADYTKQVRKEVCEEIRDKMTHWEDCLTKEVTEYVIDKETLDKIEQGETK